MSDTKSVPNVVKTIEEAKERIKHRDKNVVKANNKKLNRWAQLKDKQ